MTSEPNTLILDSYSRLCVTRIDQPSRDALGVGGLPLRLWNEVETLGITGVLTDYEGELDKPELTALAIAQLTGYQCVPLPVVENIIARALLHKAGMAAPTGLLAFGVTNEAVLDEAEALAPVLHAYVTVPWARHASHIVLAAHTQGGQRVLLLSTGEPGVTIEPGHNLAGEPRDRVRFEATRCIKQGELTNCVEWASLEAARYRAALMVGATESALDLSVAYVNERSQFGKPLGKFQAVQQSLAVFAGEVTSALSACSLAFSKPTPDWKTVAIAKMRADVAASIGCNAAHQVHGAIGVTSEYPLHLRTRRLWSWRAENGSGASWARRLGQAFITEGPESLWPALTRLR